MGEDKEKPKEKEKDPKREEKDKKEDHDPKKENAKEKEKKKEEEKDQGIKTDPKESKPREGKEIDPLKDSKQGDAKDGKNDVPAEKSPCGKEKKKEDSKGRRKKLQQGMVVKTVNHAFKVEKLLGSGGFGDVYKVSLMEKENELYALKTEYDDEQKRKVFNRLKIETMVLEDVNRGKRNTGCFTKLIDRGTTPKFRFLVMELVSHSLQYIYKDICKKQIPEHSATYLMRETLEAIATLHKLGFVHRDIKPHNFAVGLGPLERRIYILDFGIARKYLDEKRQFVVPRKKVQFLGTLKYCSRTCHLEKEQTIKDDLECWAYMCLEFHVELPWQKKKEREDILKMKIDLFAGAKENHGPWGPTKGFFAEILTDIDKMTLTDDVHKTNIRYNVQEAMKKVMKETKTDEKTALAWEGKVVPESRPRKKNMANRVLDDEDSSERKKRDEKAKRRREALARKKQIEEELFRMMKEIDDGDGPEDKKEMARRIARDQRLSDQRRRRSGGRKRRETFDDDYDDEDDDDLDDDEEDSYEEEKRKIPDDTHRRRPSRNTRRSHYRDDDSKMKRKTMRKRGSRLTNEGTFEDRRKSQKKRRNSKIRSSRRRSHHQPEHSQLLKMEDGSPPRDNWRGSGKRSHVEKGASAEKMDEDGERRDSRGRSVSHGGTPNEGSKDKASADPSPSATPIDGSDKGKKK